MVQEYLDASDLIFPVDSKGLPENVCRRITIQILEAVKYLHSMGVIHRNIKAENVMICCERSNYIIKIVDFDLSIEKPDGTGLIHG
jgi:serine/threonine protein kinase